MAPIAGKYHHEKNENFANYLVTIGVPQDKANAIDSQKPVLEVAVSGNNVNFNIDNGSEKTTNTYVLEQEVDEKLPQGIVLKSTAQVSGDTLTIKSKTQDGKNGTRVYQFSDSGLVLSLSDDSASVVAKRYYKRV